VSTVLKWAGGISVVVSLMIALHQLNGIYDSWQERAVSVKELVEAARLLEGTGDYRGSWLMVSQALELDAASRGARNYQVLLAMTWIRSLWSADEFDEELQAQLMPILHRGAVADGEGRADVMAHIGWANNLRWESGLDIDGDKNFRLALEYDTDNVYAHSMWGWGLLVYPYSDKSNDELLAEALTHFNLALEHVEQRDWVNRLRFEALRKSKIPESRVELLKAANSSRIAGMTLSPFIRQGVFGSLELVIDTPANSRHTKLENLTAAIPALQLLETADWLIEGLIGEVGFEWLTEFRVQYVVAHLLEAAERNEEALEILETLEERFPRWNHATNPAVNRLRGKLHRE
jgi:hypothetical protein